MTDKPKSTLSPSADTPITDLDGAEQHHDLKDVPSEKGDPDHAKDADRTTAQTKTKAA